MKLSSKTLLVVGIVIVISTVGAWYFYPKPVMFSEGSEGFEQGLGEWVKDAHVPPDPNNPGHPVAWEVNRVTSLSHSGQYSIELYVDGRQDDGTVWIERKIPVESGSQIRVEISFDFYSEQESFNVIAGVCAYVGIADPMVEDDFVVLGPANEVAGWKSYNYTSNLDTGANKDVWVGLGITVRWETEMTYNVDNVEVTIA